MRSEGAMEPPSPAQTRVAMSQALLAQTIVVQSQAEEARARAQGLMAVLTPDQGKPDFGSGIQGSAPHLSRWQRDPQESNALLVHRITPYLRLRVDYRRGCTAGTSVFLYAPSRSPSPSSFSNACAMAST